MTQRSLSGRKKKIFSRIPSLVIWHLHKIGIQPIPFKSSFLKFTASRPSKPERERERERERETVSARVHARVIVSLPSLTLPPSPLSLSLSSLASTERIQREKSNKNVFFCKCNKDEESQKYTVEKIRQILRITIDFFVFVFTSNVAFSVLFFCFLFLKLLLLRFCNSFF